MGKSMGKSMGNLWEIFFGNLKYMEDAGQEGATYQPTMITRPGKHTKSELENGPVEIVDLPINSMVIFQFAMQTFTRGYVGPFFFEA